MGKITLFVSGKGGVGKTTVASNIAVCLARKGKRVLVIDADIWLRNTDILLGLQSEALFDIEDIYKNKCSFEKAVLHHPTVPGLDFVAAPARLHIEGKEMFNFISEFALEKSPLYDHVFIDCPAGLSISESKLCGRKFSVTVVATYDLTSLRDAEKTVSILKKKGSRDVRLIINRVNGKQIEKKRAPDLDSVIDSVGARLIGVLPEDGKICTYTYLGKFACDEGSQKLRTAFSNVSERIDGKEVPLGKIK